MTYFLPFGQSWHDFVSIMEDGTTLTTASSAMEASIRSLRILVRVCPKTDLVDMHNDHLEGIARLATHGMKPGAIDPTLVGIARTMDEFLVRRLGTEEEID